MTKNKDEVLNKFDLYKIALETRNFEISLFWQRSNYFLVLNTAIAIGFFLKANNNFQIILSVFGIIVSLLWFFINQGSKFWQSRWETRLKKVEDDISKDINFFSADFETIQNDVKESIDYSNHSKIRQYFDKLVLLKPSVGFMMTLLSLTFIIFWFYTLVYLTLK
jgi:hypothetical protein